MRCNIYSASFTARKFINLPGSYGLILNVLLESTITTIRFVVMPPKIIIDGNILSSNKLNLRVKYDMFKRICYVIKSKYAY